MTQDEFKVLAKGMKAAYASPNFLPDEESVSVWYRLLKDLDYKVAEAAVYKHICTNKFAPTIAELREQCSKVMLPEAKDWVECWREVQKTMGTYGYNRPIEAIEKLKEFDEKTATVACRLGWVNLCMSENTAVDRANFRQCYETMQTRERESSKLPEGVKTALYALTQKFTLGGNEHSGERELGLPSKTG